jgi:hypothetical protein
MYVKASFETRRKFGCQHIARHFIILSGATSLHSDPTIDEGNAHEDGKAGGIEIGGAATSRRTPLLFACVGA